MIINRREAKFVLSESHYEGIGCLIVPGVIAPIRNGAYQGLDSIGWVFHREIASSPLKPTGS